MRDWAARSKQGRSPAADRRRAVGAAFAAVLAAAGMLGGCILGSSPGSWQDEENVRNIYFLRADLFMVRQWTLQRRDDGAGGEDVRRAGCHDQYFDGAGKADSALPGLVGKSCPELAYQQGDRMVLGVTGYGKTLQIFNTASRKFEAPIVQDSGRLQFLDDRGEYLHFDQGRLKDRKSGRVLRTGRKWVEDGFDPYVDFLWTWRDTARGCSYALVRKEKAESAVWIPRSDSLSQVKLCGSAVDSLVVLWTRKVDLVSSTYYSLFGNVPFLDRNPRDPGELPGWPETELYLTFLPKGTLAMDLPRRRYILADSGKTLVVASSTDSASALFFTYR